MLLLLLAPSTMGTAAPLRAGRVSRLRGGWGAGNDSQPRVLRSFDESDSWAGGALPKRLQRSRSESALAMLERTLSEGSIGDAKPLRAVPGERVLTFSELLARLSPPEMLEGVRPAFGSEQHADAGERPNQRAQKLVVVLVGLPARGKSYIYVNMRILAYVYVDMR